MLIPTDDDPSFNNKVSRLRVQYTSSRTTKITLSSIDRLAAILGENECGLVFCVRTSDTVVEKGNCHG